MQTKRMVIGAMLGGLVMAASAQAQVIAVHPGAVGWPAWSYHSSTYEEGVLRGWAAVGRSLGQYRYLSSLARINNETARSQYLDNQEKSVRTYFNRKRLNAEYRESEGRPRLSAQQYAELARRAAPERLTAGQYDPAVGELNWPAALQGDAFAAEREAINRLMAERTASNSGLGSPNQQAAAPLIAAMKDKLRRQIRSMSPAEYVQAKNFLLSLEYEVQSPLDVTAVAVR